MTWTGTLQTRLARQILAQARADARDHAQGCALCPRLPCEDGQVLAAAVTAARDQLAAEVAADHAPATGQETLW